MAEIINNEVIFFGNFKINNVIFDGTFAPDNIFFLLITFNFGEHVMDGETFVTVQDIIFIYFDYIF
jgi:hypothetical protein